MGLVLVTFKVMPETIDVDLQNVANECKTIIEKLDGKVLDFKEEPIGFGLSSLIIRFSINELENNLDLIEDNVRNINGVNSIDVIDVRRAIG